MRSNCEIESKEENENHTEQKREARRAQDFCPSRRFSIESEILVLKVLKILFTNK